MSNTPRTDREQDTGAIPLDSSACVGADFARQLEREITALLADRQKYASEVQQLADLIIGGQNVPAPFSEVLQRAKEVFAKRA